MAAGAVQQAEGVIGVDGRLDEADWGRAVPVTDFLRYEPTDGGPPAGTTEVRFLQDADNLYVGVRVRGQVPPVRARVSPREDINADDQIAVVIDAFGEAQEGYAFWFNPLGIQQDFRIGGGQWSVSWDTRLESVGRVVDDGYDLEIAIPFRSLRFPRGGGEQTWSVILIRKIPADGTYFSHPRLARNHPVFLSQGTPLEGVRPPERGAGLEIQPTLAVGQSWADDTWSGFDLWHEAIRPGLDLRQGLTSQLGLALAINPDFSQVESDATQINLNQRFAFYYPERRPFFLDGVDAFTDELGTMYTRSIVDPLTGVKVSGRAGPWTIGALQALDRNPAGTANSDGTAGFSSDEIGEAWADDVFMRLSHDVGRGGAVGVTVADKRLLDGSGSTNSVMALDLDVPLGGRWTVGGAGAGSLTTGMPGGGMGTVAIRRASGEGTGFSLSATEIGPDFRNEMGFLTRSGVTSGSALLDHTFEPAAIDTVRPWLSGGFSREREGDAEQNGVAGVVVEWGGVHHIDARVSGGQSTLSGVAIPTWLGRAGWRSDFGRVLGLSCMVSRAQVADYSLLVPADDLRVSFGGTLRPGSRNRLDVSVVHQRFQPTAAALDTAVAVRGKLSSQITRAWGTRLIADVSDATDTPVLTSSALVGWNPQVGTAFWLGSSQLSSLDGGELDELVVFAKLSWLLQR